jgi:hypothetical protein
VRYGALALAQVDDVAVRVAEPLDLDVAGAIASGEGPTKISPAASTSRAKSARFGQKSVSGSTASATARFATSIRRLATR